MGYTHYWHREEIIAEKKFNKISGDIEQVYLASNLPLGNGDGETKPIFTSTLIEFNGSIHCGHKGTENLGIAWPAPDAGGIHKLGDSENPISGSWFAGAKLQTRVCDGDCSYEPFIFPRRYEPEKWEEPKNGEYFNSTKTAFKPYDIVVTACLIIAKHHLRNKIIVHSDGEIQHWFDGALLCQKTVGYGLDFQLDSELENFTY